LDGYSVFIDKIREYQKKEKSLEKAGRSAINYCIKNNILKDYLEANASEVLNMLFGEWNQEEAIEVAREEALEEGMEKGIEQEKLIIAKNLLEKGSTPEFVHEITGLTLDEIEEINF
jgi:predicted transposase/invertase (TIGR01784 family)